MGRAGNFNSPRYTKVPKEHIHRGKHTSFQLLYSSSRAACILLMREASLPDRHLIQNKQWKLNPAVAIVLFGETDVKSCGAEIVVSSANHDNRRRVHLRLIFQPPPRVPRPPPNADGICEKLKMRLEQSVGSKVGSKVDASEGSAAQREREAVFDELEGREELAGAGAGQGWREAEAKVCHHLGKLQPSFDALRYAMVRLGGNLEKKSASPSAMEWGGAHTTCEEDWSGSYKRYVLAQK